MEKTCSKCKTTEQVVPTNRNSRGRWLYRSSTGMWNSSICPTCMSAYRKTLYQKKVKGRVSVITETQEPQEPELLGPNEPLFKTKFRNCVRCGNKTHNYYRCSRCLESMRFGNNSALHQADVLYG